MMQMENSVSFMGQIVSNAKVTENKDRQYVLIYLQNKRQYSDGKERIDSAPIQFSGNLAEQFLAEISGGNFRHDSVVLINGAWSSNSYQTSDGDMHTSYRIQAFNYYVLFPASELLPTNAKVQQAEPPLPKSEAYDPYQSHN